MTPPVLPFGSLGGLKGTNTAGMRHTARQRIEPGIRQPNGEYTRTPRWGSPVCCLLTDLGPEQAEIAAARGIEAKWSFKLPRGTQAPAASVWEVDRSCDGDTDEVIASTGHVLKHGRLARWIAAKDTTLNKA